MKKTMLALAVTSLLLCLVFCAGQTPDARDLYNEAVYAWCCDDLSQCVAKCEAGEQALAQTWSADEPWSDYELTLLRALVQLRLDALNKLDRPDEAVQAALRLERVLTLQLRLRPDSAEHRLELEKLRRNPLLKSSGSSAP